MIDEVIDLFWRHLHARTDAEVFGRIADNLTTALEIGAVVGLLWLLGWEVFSRHPHR